jgi:hypothetical protein
MQEKNGVEVKRANKNEQKQQMLSFQRQKISPRRKLLQNLSYNNYLWRQIKKN